MKKRQEEELEKEREKIRKQNEEKRRIEEEKNKHDEENRLKLQDELERLKLLDIDTDKNDSTALPLNSEMFNWPGPYGGSEMKNFGADNIANNELAIKNLSVTPSIPSRDLKPSLNDEISCPPDIVVG